MLRHYSSCALSTLDRNIGDCVTVFFSFINPSYHLKVFLAEFTDQWYLLAWGVNVGGFGFAIGSMANLIALRLGKARGIWIWFHLWSVPTLLFSSIGAYLLIELIG